MRYGFDMVCAQPDIGEIMPWLIIDCGMVLCGLVWLWHLGLGLGVKYENRGNMMAGIMIDGQIIVNIDLNIRSKST